MLAKHGVDRNRVPVVLPDVQDVYGGQIGRTVKAAIHPRDIQGRFEAVVCELRHPQDDKIQLAIQEAAKQLKAEGTPLVLERMKDSK